MDEASKANAPAGDQSLVLAKILLRKFNILHDFHVHQLQRYLIACCPSSMGGEVGVNPEEHIVSFEIKTGFRFKRVKGKVVPRHRLSPVLLVGQMNKKAYNAEIELAKISLTSWTKELLWGADTRVKVTIDGRSIE